MKHRTIFCTAALAAAALFTVANHAPAQAQQMTQTMKCGDHVEVMSFLEDRYKEQPVALGLDNSGKVVQIVVAPSTGTWTILVTTPQNMTCVVAAGTAWEDIKTASLDPVS